MVLSARFEVTREVYDGFVLLSGDRNPLHMKDDFARSAGFRERVMHGNILNVFLSYFIGELLPVKNVVIHTQEIKYAFPVYLGDVLDLVAEITEYYESVNVYLFRFYFKNEADKKVARGSFQIGILV